jgi:hypothetical protein
MQISLLLLANKIKYEHASISIYWYIVVPDAGTEIGYKNVFVCLEQARDIYLIPVWLKAVYDKF